VIAGSRLLKIKIVAEKRKTCITQQDFSKVTYSSYFCFLADVLKLTSIYNKYRKLLKK